jgi:hypothetical protein
VISPYSICESAELIAELSAELILMSCTMYKLYIQIVKGLRFHEKTNEIPKL